MIKVQLQFEYSYTQVSIMCVDIVQVHGDSLVSGHALLVGNTFGVAYEYMLRFEKKFNQLSRTDT